MLVNERTNPNSVALLCEMGAEPQRKLLLCQAVRQHDVAPTGFGRCSRLGCRSGSIYRGFRHNFLWFDLEQHACCIASHLWHRRLCVLAFQLKDSHKPHTWATGCWVLNSVSCACKPSCATSAALPHSLNDKFHRACVAISSVCRANHIVSK